LIFFAINTIFKALLPTFLRLAEQCDQREYTKENIYMDG